MCNNIEKRVCCKRSCKPYIELNCEHKVIFGKIDHNHNKDTKQKLNRQQVCYNVKRKALDDPIENPSKTLHRELLNGDISTWTTDDTCRVRKNLHYIFDKKNTFYRILFWN